MFRTTVLAAGVLLFLNVAALACDGADCPPPQKVKPLNIAQFMREQAASTRGGSLRPVTNRAARMPAVTRRLASPRQDQVSLPASGVPIRTADRGHRTVHATAKRYVFHSRTVAAQPKPAALPVDSTSFAEQDPVVPMVRSDELNAIDQRAPAFAAAPVATGQNVRQLVAEAFDDIDRTQEGSLTTDDLRAANERAKFEQNRITWLQRM
jgi:hypothetical protein